MASLNMKGKGNANNIASMLSKEIQNSGFSCELIDSVYKSIGSVTICVMVFEKYYMRSSNRASLTVVVTGEGDDVNVDAIGSGGGQGVLFKLSWGAEENFVSTVEQILKRYGFR